MLQENSHRLFDIALNTISLRWNVLTGFHFLPYQLKNLLICFTKFCLQFFILSSHLLNNFLLFWVRFLLVYYCVVILLFIINGFFIFSLILSFLSRKSSPRTLLISSSLGHPWTFEPKTLNLSCFKILILRIQYF